MKPNKFIKETKLDITDAVKRAKEENRLVFIMRIIFTVMLICLPIIGGMIVALDPTLEHILFFIISFLCFLIVLMLLVQSIILNNALSRDAAERRVFLYHNTIAERDAEIAGYTNKYYLELVHPYRKFEKVRVAIETYDKVKAEMKIVLVVGKHSKYPLDIYLED